MTVNLNGIFSSPDHGTSYSVVGNLCTFKAVSEDTGGAYALFEVFVPPQAGTPAHIHSHEDEAFYILEGEIEFQLNEQIIVATPNTFLHSPKGQLHRFINIGSELAKMLCWAMPGGIEKFFAEVGKPIEDPQAPLPAVEPADIEKILAIAPKYGIEIIPPASDSSQ